MSEVLNVTVRPVVIDVSVKESGPTGPAGVVQSLVAGTGIAVGGTAAAPSVTLNTASNAETVAGALSTKAVTPAGRAAAALTVDARRYGVVADRPINAGTALGGTDNTTAMNNAIAALSDAVAAYARETGGSNPTYAWARPTLVLPPGRIRVGDLAAITFPNLRVVGAGRDSTVLHHTGSTALFTLGTFTTTPSSPYQGTASGFTLAALSLVQVQELGNTNEGARTRTAIADNFCGGVTIKDCSIAGFQYGYFNPAGGDFTLIEDTFFRDNDVAAYFGPASDQSRVQGCQFYENREALVLGGSQMSVKDCWFIDSKEYHIVRESNTLTRGGAAVSGVSYDERPIDIGSCWFEDNAAATGRIAKASLYISSNTTGMPRNINVHDGIVVAGGSTVAHKRAFVKAQMMCRRVDVSRMIAAGTLDWWVEREAGEFPIVRLIDVDTQDGYTAIPYWGNGTTVDTGGWGGAVSLAHGDNIGTLRTRVGSGATVREMANHDDSALVREVLNADGTITYGEYVSALWRDRMKFDIEGASWIFRPDSATPVAISRDGVTTALSSNKGFHTVELAADPATPAANSWVLYARDNGSGKTQLCVRFPTGAVQVVATEP